MRKMAVAGMFYPSDKTELIKLLESFSITKGKGAKNIIVPHAGLSFSGKCAAKAYSELKEDTFVLIGPNHRGNGSGILLDDMETPLGNIKVDKEYARYISEKSGLLENPEAHRFEHSLEVQLPFIKYLYPNAKIVPIVLSAYIDLSFIDKPVIISSDFTHHGKNFGYTPFKEDISENVKKQDMKAFEILNTNNKEQLIDYVNSTKATICGIYPLLSMIGKYNLTLLDNYTSADVTNDESIVVNYISAVSR